MARAEAAVRASEAHVNLTVFAAVAQLLESGLLCGHNAQAERIMRLCAAEQQRQLAIYEAAIAAVRR